MPYSVPFNSVTKLLHVGQAFSIAYESEYQQEEYCLQVSAAVTSEETTQHLAVGFTEILAGSNQLQSPHRLRLSQTSSCNDLGEAHYPTLLLLLFLPSIYPNRASKCVC